MSIASRLAKLERQHGEREVRVRPRVIVPRKLTPEEWGRKFGTAERRGNYESRGQGCEARAGGG